MSFRRKTIKILIVFVAILLLFGISEHTASKDQRKYNELIQSYEKDHEYKTNTDAMKKNVQSDNAGIASEAFNGPSFPKPYLRFFNSGKLEGIPILIYHCIDNTVWGDKPMFVTPENFEEQMKYLKDNGYTAITFQDLGQLDSIRNPVMITFDDGYEDNYTNAYPILKKYGLKATVFLIVDTINKPRFLSLQEIRSMEDIIDFQSHTMSHPHLAGLDPSKIETELSDSKKSLEDMLRRRNIDVIAYPYGSYDKTVIMLAKKYYAYGVTTNYGKFYDTPQDEYTIKRLYVINKMNLKSFIKLFR